MTSEPPAGPTHLDVLKAEQDGERFEVQGGRLVCMSGGSLNHAQIAARVLVELTGSLRELGCDARCFTSDARLRVDHDPSGSHRYPDVSVVCGDLEVHGEDERAFTNPAILVEVTSPGTVLFDRNGKRDIYLGCASLKAYLIVSQDARHIELHTRNHEVVTAIAGGSLEIDVSDEGAIELDVDQVYQGIL